MREHRLFPAWFGEALPLTPPYRLCPQQDGASKRKEANNSLYFPSPDPSYHPHVPYSTYKLMRHNTGVGGASSHSPTQQQRHEMPVNKPVLKHSISQDCAVDLRQLACQEPTIQVSLDDTTPHSTA